VIAGLILAGAGALLWAGARLPWFGVLGSLPGDIVLRRGPLMIVIPVTSMILISMVLTVVGNLVMRAFRR
jgi:hypothetical protein